MHSQTEVLAKMNAAADKMQALTDKYDSAIDDLHLKAENTSAAILAGISNTAGFVSVWLDSNGNDSNDGMTSQTPVATIEKALSLVPDGRSAIIYMKAQQTFSITSSVSLFQRSILFFKIEDRGNVTTNPKITVASSVTGSTNSIATQIVLFNSAIFFDLVDVEVGDKTNPALGWSNSNSLVTTDNSYGGFGHIACTGNKLTVPPGTSLVKSHVSSNLNIIARYFEVTGGGHLCGDADWGTVTAAVYLVTETGGSSLLSGLQSNSNGTTNILTNYSGAIA